MIHELGHALGLGHLPDAASVMFDTLIPGGEKRVLLASDLNIGNEHGLPGHSTADLSRIPTREPSAGISPLHMGDAEPDAAVHFDNAWAASVFMSGGRRRFGTSDAGRNGPHGSQASIPNRSSADR